MAVQLLHPVAAAATLVMAAISAVALQSYVAGHFVASCTSLGIGFLFMGKSMVLATMTGALALPVVIGWMRRAQLVTPVRV